MIERYLFTVPFILLIFLIRASSSLRLKMAARRYSKEKHGVLKMSGGALAQKIIRDNGMYVEVTVGRGFLNDYYDATRRVLHLSKKSYYGRDIVSVATAAHEAGHALQHLENYPVVLTRALMLPAANISSKLSIPCMMLGLFFDSVAPFTKIGLVMIGIYLALHLINIPLERGASRRAIEQIKKYGLMDDKQLRKAKRFL